MLLITGATGFIGKKLLSYLENKKEVYIFKGDITNKESFIDIPKEVSEIVHLAGVIEDGNKDKLWKVNVGGTKNLVDWASSAKIKKLVFISSLNVKLKFKGDYGESKLAAENIVKTSPLNWTIIRPSLVYGQGDTRNLGKIIKFLKISPVMVMVEADRVEIRPLLVDDLIIFIGKVLKTSKTAGKIYDLAGKETISYRQLVDILAQKINKKILMRINIPMGLLKFSLPMVKLFSPKLAGSIGGYQRLIDGYETEIDDRWLKEMPDFHLTGFKEGISRTEARF